MQDQKGACGTQQQITTTNKNQSIKITLCQVNKYRRFCGERKGPRWDWLGSRPPSLRSVLVFALLRFSTSPLRLTLFKSLLLKQVVRTTALWIWLCFVVFCAVCLSRWGFFVFFF
ncbi:hypothetical protein CAOG_009878 [Capsaspora owczarzaki ATCC 30864]|uniref:Transmembrane protein n=1 Tax=Capsaspora owczarzaki (strain ATCC 30864) TaxID=595528 RepID=A0A0D2UJ93_CAPO3|nr:hypothetical protein CAOG_009878 [Capsaspora owczarzaki ATCC 30864]